MRSWFCILLGGMAALLLRPAPGVAAARTYT